MKLLKILAITLFVLMTFPRPTPDYVTECIAASPAAIRSIEVEIDPSVFEQVKPIEPEELGLEDLDQPSEDEYLLAKLVYGEARGESMEGKIAVANVVINRLKSKRNFGETIEEVIYKEGQFDCVTQDEWEDWEPDADSYEAARLVMSGYTTLDPDVVFFHNPKTSTDRSQVGRVRVVKTIGNHDFGK